jgi:tRNA threonylcarbamoyladenosine biosynthesis protein TsaE
LKKDDRRAGFCYDLFIKEFTIKNEEEMGVLADYVLHVAMEQEKQHPGTVVITLQGELGSGKTTFTKALAKRLGIAESVTSPTFVILKRYKINAALSPAAAPVASQMPFENLVHIDAYRIREAKEMERIGFENFIKNSSPKNILCIEWPEIIENLLPSRRIAMKFLHVHEGAFSSASPEESHLRKVTVEQKV